MDRTDGGGNERLVRLGEVWSAIRYFHPYLAYRPIDWDAAFVSAVPRVRAVAGPGEYAFAIQSMLDRLEDPVTRVVSPAMSGTAKHLSATPVLDTVNAPRELISWPVEGVLSITLSAGALQRGFQKTATELAAISRLLEGATGLLIDLRTTVQWTWIDDLLQTSGVEAAIVPRTLTAPRERSRMHLGLANGRSGRYRSGFREFDGRVFTPSRRGHQIPIVFLVNAATSLPAVMLALQDAKLAVILAEGPVTDESLVGTHTISLGDGIEVRMRLGELVRPGGKTGFEPDEAVSATPEGAAGDSALECALELLRSFPATSTSLRSHPSTAAPPSAPAVETVLPPTEAGAPYPSVEERALAAVQIWSAIHYFFPYRDLMEEDWDQVLRQCLPHFLEAGDALAYHLAAAEMYTHIRDSHGYVRSEILASHFGAAPSAICTRWIEDLPLVCGFRDEDAARTSGIEIGDILVEIDGEDASDRLRRYARHTAASTPHRLLARAADAMLFGADGIAARLQVRGRDGQVLGATVPRSADYPVFPAHRSGPVVRLLDEAIGYIDLTRLENEAASAAMDQLRGCRGIVFDLRGYPRPLAPATILARLAADPEVPYAKLEAPLLFGPAGEHRQRYAKVQRLPGRDPANATYPGRVAVLIDERTQSYAEHVGLAFETVPGTIFVGSHSAGADGDITGFAVSGGITFLLSGQAVRHGDGRQLQRIGLEPHLFVRPTLEGIRAGRDEVLQAALHRLRLP